MLFHSLPSFCIDFMISITVINLNKKLNRHLIWNENNMRKMLKNKNSNHIWDNFKHKIMHSLWNVSYSHQITVWYISNRLTHKIHYECTIERRKTQERVLFVLLGFVAINFLLTPNTLCPDFLSLRRRNFWCRLSVEKNLRVLHLRVAH